MIDGSFLQILTISNLINSAPLKEDARAGYPAYEYPRWSTILGWCIFVVCVIPIPLVFIISYIRQYRKLAAKQRVSDFDTLQYHSEIHLTQF